VQKFTKLSDLKKYRCTIEEQEEYEPHIRRGTAVFAGVDYQKILRAAEKISDIIVWDGGNNDLSFYCPDLHIVVCDPFRVGHELTYHPGEANLRAADVVVINKVDTAPAEKVRQLERNIRQVNPKATVIRAESPITVSRPELIRGRRALVVEDGPTLTHGNMAFGAGVVAARKYRARQVVRPRKFAVGSIAKAYERFPHLGDVVPALGYGEQQMKELEKTINRIPAEVVILATPVNLGRFLKLNKPAVKVSYELKEVTKPNLNDIIDRFLHR
jgi:predicted GTPase